MGRAEEIFEKLRREGESAIDEFILIRQSEELYLDFKRSADDGSGPRALHDNDRNNLAKAISGFGNSEGGVVIWGVDAHPGMDFADVAQAKRPIENIARFVSWLEGTVSGRTVAAHTRVQNLAIDIGSGKGFVATLIPKSELAPHQCIFDSRYYMRAGSNFLPVPHAVLAGMFGRRPQPVLFQTFIAGPAHVMAFPNEPDRPTQIEVSLGFQIYNRGPVLARDLYSDLRLFLPKTKCSASFALTSDDWTNRMEMGVWLTSVSKSEFRLAPESFTRPFTLHVAIAPPFLEGRFFMRWTFGCDGAPMNLMEIEYSHTEIERLYRDFIAGPQDNEAGHKFVDDLFKLPKTRKSAN
jgi:hypothetical protein